MAITNASAWDAAHCERAPIVAPGAIQPHGLLFVVDPATDVILQMAGDAPGRLGFAGPVVGATLESVLGHSLAALTEASEAPIGEYPAYLATVGPAGPRSALAIIAHKVQGVAILEASPAQPAPAAGVLAAIRSITQSIGGAANLADACDQGVGAVRRINGYDRVMIYQFVEGASGAVVAEAREPHLPAFLHQRYPASDIPKPARDLYLRSTVRIIPDVNYRPAPLMPELLPPARQPLDMSLCILRAMAPSHLQYLKNMGVTASMSLSLIVEGELWGLITCHDSRPHPLAYEALEACQHVADLVSQRISVHQVADRYRVARAYAEARGRNERTLWTAADPVNVLFDLGDDVQAVVRSNAMAACSKDRIATTGAAPSAAEIGALAAWLKERMSDVEVFSTDRLAELYAPALAFAAQASGLVAIMLPGDDPILLLWFRCEEVEEIRWAGNPYEAQAPGLPGAAPTPRLSFEPWIETVRGRSRPWEPLDIESALDFAERTTFVLQQMSVRNLNAELTDANQRLAAEALTDGLTGLSNRRAFDRHLRREWSRGSRTGAPLAMVMIDLDFFKQFNDEYGHGAGDDCLRRVARYMAEGRRAADLTARIGGEEFAILLPETTLAGARKVAEAVRSRIEGGRIPHVRSPFGVMTASFGVSVASADRSATPEILTLAADQALYEAKHRGRNRVVDG